MLEIIAILVLFAAIIATTVGMIILKSWVLIVLWEWFIVPFGISSLTIAWALGIFLLVSFLTGNHPDLMKKERSDWVVLATTLEELFRMGIVLGIGWIAHNFM
jgi:hypothetical protein